MRRLLKNRKLAASPVVVDMTSSLEVSANKGYPATGTSFGIERIIDVMEEFDMFPATVGKTVTQVLVTVFDAELAQESLKVAALLRRSGIRTEVYCRPARISAQIKYADTKSIPYAVILGSDEVEAGTVAVRDLANREQHVVSRGEVAERIQEWTSL